MDIQNEQKIFRSGFVTVVGKPNVGKSTLLNSLMGQKIAAVSLRPQTTRKRQLGILTTDQAQIIFVDTPGLHKPDYKLSQFINAEAYASLNDADLVLILVDASSAPDQADQQVAERLTQVGGDTLILLVLNKWDLVLERDKQRRIEQYETLYPHGMVIEISALSKKYLKELLERIIELLPEGPQFYPEDQVTDKQEREISEDLIRAACLVYLMDEIPHSIAVRVDEFSERDENTAYIHATIFVERESHKGMVIGKQGAMLKQIGTLARQEIEQMSGRSVFLELKVKVASNWRNDPFMLARFGYGSEGK